MTSKPPAKKAPATGFMIAMAVILVAEMGFALIISPTGAHIGDALGLPHTAIPGDAP
jgi:hypothetical protein